MAKPEQPTHDVFAVVHRTVTNKETGQKERQETLTELGPAWPTRNGHLRCVMNTEPLEWRIPNNTERVLIIVERGNK